MSVDELIELYSKIKAGTASEDEQRMFEFGVDTCCIDTKVLFSIFESKANNRSDLPKN